MSWLTRAFRRDSVQKVQRSDSWANVITGLLTDRDKRTGGQHVVDLVTDIQARDMWRGDDIAKRVIEVLPREAMRRGYQLKVGDEDKEVGESVMGAAESLGVDQAIVKAAQYERAYGGSAILPVIEGALGDMQEPLSETGLQKIQALHILEPRELYPVSWYTDITEPKFGRPEMYRCIPLFAGGVMSSPMVLVHESRLVIFPGNKVTRLPQPGTLLGWGDNVLTPMYRVLDDYGQSWGTVASLLQDFSQAVLSIQGLDNMSDSKRGKTAKARLEQIDMLRHAMRAVVIDSKDSFKREQTPLSNLAEIMDRFATRLAAAADMPITLLMGMSPAGLNATGESDRAFFYDRVSALQHYLTPMVEHLLRLLMLTSEGPLEGVEPESWSIDWKPLWAPSEKETADTRYVNSQADALGCQWGWFTPEEVRSRYQGDTYGDIVLDDDAFDAQSDMDVDVSDLSDDDKTALGAGNDELVDIVPSVEGPTTGQDATTARPKKGTTGGTSGQVNGRKVPVRQHERTIRG